MNSWLLIAAGDDRQHGGNDGYVDEPDVSYSWDDTVQNHGAVAVGDRIALWDKQVLLGISVIEEIHIDHALKELYRCPACGQAGIKARKVLVPKFKCHKCHSEFEEPDTKMKSVMTYKSRHNAAWVNLAGVVSGSELRQMTVTKANENSPGSMLAIRRLDWDLLSKTLQVRGHSDSVQQVEKRETMLPGGHAIRKVRARRGQSQFRRKLLDKYGDACAITGPSPEATLEAAHLYSYSKIGEHHDHGGLLLRRDIHSLFDRGYIAVHPGTGVLSVTEELLAFPTYAPLQGQNIQVDLASAQRDWLKAHWEQHRELDTSKS